jgi:flagellar assembly factor FliW
MPILNVEGTELEYGEADIITFAEGLIGLPHLRRMVLVNRAEAEPFLWLASVDEPETAFLVLDPRLWTPGYQPALPESLKQLSGAADETLVVLAIVTIAADWAASTINLRAPIVISPSTMQGAQVILTESTYKHNEPLPQAQAA